MSGSAGGIKRQAGVTLVELMIALLLGLIVVGAAGGLLRTSQQTYRTTEETARLQEGARTAFELLAKDIREAGASPCPGVTQMLNIVTPDKSKKNNTDAQLDPLNFGSNIGINGTSSRITLLNGLSEYASIDVDNYSLQSGQFGVNDPQSVTIDTPLTFADGELVVICDPATATKFMVTGTPGNSDTIQFKSGKSGYVSTVTNQPCVSTKDNTATCVEHYNISKCLGPLGAEGNGHCLYKFGCEKGALPAGLDNACYTGDSSENLNSLCKNNSANSKGCPAGFGKWPAYLVKFYSVSWFVDNSSAMGANGTTPRKALFRQIDGQPKQEIALGVNSVNFGYLMQGGTTYQNSPTGGVPVVGVRVRMNLDTEAGAGEGGELSRVLEFTVAPRNFAG